MATTKPQLDQSIRPRYWANLKKVPAAMSEMLENYSHIPPGPDQQTQIDHILAVRDPLYEAHPYVCLGNFRFVEVDLSTHGLYKTDVVPRMTKPPPHQQQQPIFLDLGTCLSQDLRKLIHDGAPPTACFGADIIPAYIDAGYALFKDADRLPRSQFFCPINIFETDPEKNALLKGLGGKVDIVHATAFFHLFSLPEQKVVAKQCLRLLRKDGDLTQDGSKKQPCIVLGKQVGHVQTIERKSPKVAGRTMFRHNEESWRAMWAEVIDQEEFKGLVKNVEMGVIMHDGLEEVLQERGGPENNTPLPEGMRWMEYWVKVWF